MNKYGVVLHTPEIESTNDKTASDVKTRNRCHKCKKPLDDGRACPIHGTEPLEKTRNSQKE